MYAMYKTWSLSSYSMIELQWTHEKIYGMQARLIIPLVPDTSGELSTTQELCTDFVFVFQDYFAGTVVMIAPILAK